MSEHKKEAKASSAAKLQRMGLKLDDGSKSFTDERGGSPFEGLNSGNAGKMPITPSRFKRGGKVAHVMGEKAHKNLGKSTRRKREDGGGVENAIGPNPVPVPPRKNDKKYNPFPYLPTKKQIGDQYAKEHPDSPTDLGASSSYARGGFSSMNPAKRKAAIGAMVARKNKMGAPSAPPPSRGILPASVIPMSSPVPAMGRKRGGKAEHPDVAEDKKLVKQMVKPSALKHRAHKAGGGPQPILDAQQERLLHRKRESRNSMEGIDNLADYGRSLRMDSHGAFMRNYHENMKKDMDKENASLTSSGLKRGGKAEMHHSNCTCKMCSGGMAYRSKKFDGGGITGMNPMMQRPGTTQPNMMLRPPMGQGPGMGQSAMGQGPFNPMGNRPMRASGGRTKAGKTNVNIIISPQSGQGQAPLGAGVGMGQPPVPPMMPPMGGMPPMPPGGAMPPMMPPGGAPAGLPPQLMAALAAKGGAGGPPPMARKSGGRVGNVMPKYQEKDYGSGSGLGRLEKKKWPVADGTE